MAIGIGIHGAVDVAGWSLEAGAVSRLRGRGLRNNNPRDHAEEQQRNVVNPSSHETNVAADNEPVKPQADGMNSTS